MKKLVFLFLTLISFASIAQYDKYEDQFAAINDKGEIVFTFWAKNAYPFENDRAAIRKYIIKGTTAYYLRGFLDANGNLAVPCEYDKVKDFTTNVTWVRKQGEDVWRLIDKNGQAVTSKTFEKVSNFYDGMARFGKGLLYGFVNEEGEIVIPAQYVGGHFSEGLVCLSKANSSSEAYGFLNKKGEVVIPFQYNQAGHASFKDGLARVKINGKTGLIDKEGNIVVEPKYPTVNCVNAKEKIMAVSSGGYKNFKYVTFDYEPLFDMTFDGVDPFIEGRAVVSKEIGVNGLVDVKGNFIIPFGKYDILNKLGEDGYVLKMEDIKDANGKFIERKMSYYDKDGNPFTTENASRIGSAGEGVFLPYYDPEVKLWGYLDKNGNQVIQPMFEKAKSFGRNGLGIVQLKKGVTVPVAGSTNTTTSGKTVESTHSSDNANTINDKAENFKKGDLVLAQWSDGWWYPAKIVGVGNNYQVAYYDGYTGNNPASKIKKMNWKRGNTIYANWQGKGKYWEATINDISGEQINITYTSDRSTDQVNFKQCRSK